MARINLLPWREERRQRRQRDFVSAIIAGVVVTLLAGFAVQMQFSSMIDSQNRRNEYLTEEIRKLDEIIKEIDRLESRKQDLLARMKIIQTLQESRPEIVRLFDELVRAIPEGVFLVDLKQNDGNITVQGRAQSNARVSALMRNIEDSEWIGSPQLLVIENKDQTGTGLSHFRLSFKQQRKKKDDQDGQGEAG
ncbi:MULTISPECIES: PilN domain-containing protein [Thiorhodovibrio]|uniref:PilN domain-containing protein n=1 Tax=Thiorhodovibrio TaxID=61593 RepID=UPI0019144EE8|nr:MULTISPECIES: PilN domain-containing protein [Thiorhodovibrio]MBK5967855.1 pilus assembly protein PilN [Thiorhodovibrio winogradskyi]WPL14080.1 Fimbrial assembly protein (PilN) [Thiorhodovibrio litoralis]